MKKKVVVIICVLALMMSMAACSPAAEKPSAPAGSSASDQVSASQAAVASSASQAVSEKPSDSQKQKYIIFVNPLVGNPVFTDEENGMKQAAKDFGFNLKIIGPSVIDDAQMVQAVENAVAEKPDAIITVPYDYSALANTYKEAKEKGIPILNTSSDSPAESRVTFVGTDNTKYGQLAADYIAKKTNNKANVCIMMAKLDVSNQLEQKTAFEAAIKEKYPDIKVVITEQDSADAQTALQKYEDIFSAHPEIDTVFELESIGGNSAVKVFDEKGMTGKVNILAIDAIQETIDNIKAGKIWATMAQNFYKMGYVSGKFAMDYLAGKSVPPVFDSGTLLITKDNVATYQDEMAKVN
jgi:ribose transport system substrate-binding protein